MAKNNVVVVAIVSVMLLVNLPRGKAASKDDVRGICASTQDPAYCSSAINSDHRTPAASPTGLAQIAIDLAAGGAKKAEALVAKLIQRAAEGQLKDRYRACQRNFAAAAEVIGVAARDLAAGDGKGVSDSGLDGLNKGEDCRDEFEVPPEDPSELPGLVGNLITLCGAVFFAAQHV